MPADKEKLTEFDFDRQFDHLRNVVGEISAQYPSGAWEWLSANRLDVINGLQKCVKDVDEAFQSHNNDKINRRLEVFRLSHFKAWDIFNGRPPFIERQDEFPVDGLND